MPDLLSTLLIEDWINSPGWTKLKMVQNTIKVGRNAVIGLVRM